MNPNLPNHLISTKRMIDAAYPGGLTDVEYFAVLKVLYPHMSDRNLAEVVAACSSYPESRISNDIAKVAVMSEAEIPALPSVLSDLKRAGFDCWIDEK